MIFQNVFSHKPNTTKLFTSIYSESSFYTRINLFKSLRPQNSRKPFFRSTLAYSGSFFRVEVSLAKHSLKTAKPPSFHFISNHLGSIEKSSRGTTTAPVADPVADELEYRGGGSLANEETQRRRRNGSSRRRRFIWSVTNYTACSNSCGEGIA